MKRASRIVLTCLATTGAITGAAATVNSIATAATGPTSTTTPAAAAALPNTEKADLQRQARLLHSRITLLNRQIDAERRKAARGTANTAGPVASAAAQPLAQAPAVPGPEPVATYATPRSVAAAPAPVLVPTPPPPVTVAPVPAPTPPPVQTTTGASGSTTGQTTEDGGHDD